MSFHKKILAIISLLLFSSLSSAAIDENGRYTELKTTELFANFNLGYGSGDLQGVDTDGVGFGFDIGILYHDKFHVGGYGSFRLGDASLFDGGVILKYSILKSVRVMAGYSLYSIARTDDFAFNEGSGYMLGGEYQISRAVALRIEYSKSEYDSLKNKNTGVEVDAQNKADSLYLSLNLFY